MKMLAEVSLFLLLVASNHVCSNVDAMATVTATEMAPRTGAIRTTMSAAEVAAAEGGGAMMIENVEGGTMMTAREDNTADTPNTRGQTHRVLQDGGAQSTAPIPAGGFRMDASNLPCYKDEFSGIWEKLPGGYTGHSAWQLTKPDHPTALSTLGAIGTAFGADAGDNGGIMKLFYHDNMGSSRCGWMISDKFPGPNGCGHLMGSKPIASVPEYPPFYISGTDAHWRVYCQGSSGFVDAPPPIVQCAEDIKNQQGMCKPVSITDSEANAVIIFFLLLIIGCCCVCACCGAYYFLVHKKKAANPNADNIYQSNING